MVSIRDLFVLLDLKIQKRNCACEATRTSGHTQERNSDVAINGPYHPPVLPNEPCQPPSGYVRESALEAVPQDDETFCVLKPYNESGKGKGAPAA